MSVLVHHNYAAFKQHMMNQHTNSDGILTDGIKITSVRIPSEWPEMRLVRNAATDFCPNFCQ